MTLHNWLTLQIGARALLIQRFNYLCWLRQNLAVYPQSSHPWQCACKYYPVFCNPAHNATLAHLPEAPTFTSGFAGAWARVAVRGKVLIYRAESGLVWWARWPWPDTLQATGEDGPRRGSGERRRAEGMGRVPLTLRPSSFSPFISLFLLLSPFHTLSHSVSRSLDENSTNHLRINSDSDNTTSNSSFIAAAVTRGLTQHHSHTYKTCGLISICQICSAWLQYKIASATK